MKSPNLICLGAQKAGTTTLHDILKNHPQIYLPHIKEAPFFNDEESYSKGMDWWLDYHFSSYNDEQILGVMTPEYLYYEEVPKRIFDDCGPDVKLIVILREPVSRAHSQYLMSVRKGFESLTFNEAIEVEPKRILEGPFERDSFSYIGRGRYAEQIKRYQDLFDPKNILFLCFETDICNKIDETIQRIQSFIGVEQIDLNTNIKSNSARETRSKYFQDLTSKPNFLRRILRSIFGKRFSHWIRFKLAVLNEKKLSDESRLTRDEKKALYEKFYKSDFIELERMTGLDLKHWEIK